MTVSERLAQRRSPGETLVEVDEDSSGPVLVVVTDRASALVDSITVLLHRLGVGYLTLTHSSPSVTRDADGLLTGVDTGGGAGPLVWFTPARAPPGPAGCRPPTCSHPPPGCRSPCRSRRRPPA